MFPLNPLEVALFGIPVLLYVIPFAFSMNLAQRERATRKDYELEKIADFINVNPFSSKTGSKTVGSTWQLVGYLVFAYVYTINGPKQILRDVGQPLGVDLVYILAFQKIAEALGGLAHIVYVLGLLLGFLIVGVVFFFSSSIPYGVINGGLVALLAKFRGIPLLISAPIFVTSAFVFKLHRQYRYIFTTQPVTHEESTQLLRQLIAPIVVLLSGSDAHFECESLFTVIDRTTRSHAIKWSSQIESILFLGFFTFVVVDLFSGWEQSWVTMRLGMPERWIQRRFSLSALSTVIGVLLILHGRSFTVSKSVGGVIVDRLFITLLGGIAVIGSVVFNPTLYLAFLPNFWTIFDIVVLIYIPWTVGLLTVHLLDLHPKVIE